MKPGWNRMVMMMAGVLMAGAAGAADTPASDTTPKRAGPARAETRGAPPAAATPSERFPFRFVGLGGTDRRPEFIALTDGTNSFVARAGDVIGERYRITELRASEFVLTDLKSGKKGIIISYKDIQAPPAELTSQDAAGAASRSPIEAIPAAVSTSRGSAAEPARGPDSKGAGDEEKPDSDISTMIAPPPVNRAEQPLPMEMTPPPERNPLITTSPPKDVPMITTPSRREHQAPLDIPLGPEK